MVHRARTAYRDRNIATRRGEGSKGSEGLAGCFGAKVVDPRLLEPAHPVRSRSIRLAWLPEAKYGGLGHLRVCARHVDHERIGRRLNVGDKTDTAAVLDQRSVVQIEMAAEIPG